MEFTPEQQAYIDTLISESKKGLFTEEDLNRKVTSEVDRRVESGIQKGLETYKAKWELEFAEKAKLSAEELAQKELEEKLKDISSKEQEIKKRSNLIDAKDMLANAQIPKSHYEKFINLLVSDDEESTKTNVQNFINTFNETKTEIESEVQKKYMKVPSPTDGDGSKVVTKEDFDKMSYVEKLKLKQTNPELYKTLIV